MGTLKLVLSQFLRYSVSCVLRRDKVLKQYLFLSRII